MGHNFRFYDLKSEELVAACATAGVTVSAGKGKGIPAGHSQAVTYTSILVL